MSPLSIKDLYPSDLLSDLKLKPWWETIRGYGYVAGVTSMLSLLIATFPRVTVSCLSVGEDRNQLPTLTTVQAAAINSYCVRFVPWYVRYSGLIALSTMVILYLIEIFWTLVPGVKESLTKLSNISEKISEINMRVHEMKTQSVLPIKETPRDKDLKLRDIVMLLTQPFNSVNVTTWYVGRSLILFVFLVIFWGMHFFAYWRFDFAVSFLCDARGYSARQNARNLTINFSCIINASSVYLLVYSIALAFQAIFMLLGLVIICIWSVENMMIPFTKKSNDNWNEPGDMYRKHAIKLLCLFMKFTNPDLAGDVREFTKFVLSEDFRDKQGLEMVDAIISNDLEFFRITKICYEKTKYEQYFGTDVAFCAELVLRDAENPADFKIGATDEERKETDADYKIFNLLLNLFPHHRNQKDELLKQSIDWSKNNRWHLLACSPVFYTNDFEKEFKENHLFDKFDIKFDQLDKEGRSFLYYALRNSSLNRILTRFEIVFDILLQKTRPLETASFVHFDGKSMLTKDFFYDQYKDRFRGNLPNLQLCEVEEKSIGSNSKTKLEEIFKKYRKIWPK